MISKISVTYRRSASVAVALSLVFAACGPQNSHRESVLDQQTADSQAKFQELAPAEGAFNGTVKMTHSGESFAATLTLERVMDNARTTQSTDPSVTTSLPKLSGNLSFPALKRVIKEDPASRGDYTELLNPLGWQGTALIDMGDFNPKSRQLVLPYLVSSYSSQVSFGELKGTLDGGHFTGTWFSKPYGTVATLDLYLTTATAAGGNP